MKGPGRARLAGETGGRSRGAGWGGVSTCFPAGECGVGGVYENRGGERKQKL